MTIVDSRASRRKTSSSGQSTGEGANACDWPLKFEDLEPYYEEVEEALQIAGPTFHPWGRRRKRYPQREHELNASAQMLVRGQGNFLATLANNECWL